MLIVCPKCLTKYLISDNTNLSKVQKCHCSACGFYFEPQADEETVSMSVSPVLEQKTEPLNANPVLNSNDESFNSEQKASRILEDTVPPSLFSEPLNSDEKANKKSRSEAVPEEFKPVDAKKSSFLGTLFWLSIGATICFFAYKQKDYFLDKLDAIVMEQLDKSNENKTGSVNLSETKTTVASQKAAAFPPLQVKTEEKVLEPSVSEAQDYEAGINESLSDEKIDYHAVLNVQNISYEIGVNEVGINRLLIRGFVVNTSLKNMKLPETKAVIYDDEDNIVARKRIIYLEKELAGNSEIMFETAVVPAPKSVSKIEVVFDE